MRSHGAAARTVVSLCSQHCAASLGVIFGTLDATSLLLIAASAAVGALVRRWLSASAIIH